MHRHAPKRHAAVSFVVTHEGCGADGSGARQYGFDRDRRKIGRIRGPQGGDRSSPRVSGTPKNPTNVVNLDIGRPLLQRQTRRRRWSPTEEIGWSRTQEIRWSPTEEIGWIQSEEILHVGEQRYQLTQLHFHRPSEEYI